MFSKTNEKYTDPLCPPNLFKILRDVVSQIYVNLSDDPADILEPSWDQHTLSKFLS